MIASGRYGFANARFRAMKSRLLVVSASRRRAELEELAHRRFRELIAAYDMVIASYPTGRSLFLALLRLHEIENLELVWRAIVRGVPVDRWLPYWIPLGARAAIDAEACRDCRSLSALVDALKGTPYHAVADTMRRAHAADLAAAELGFDRWASQALADAAESLPGREHLTRDLAMAIVRDRDLNVVRRATTAYALPPDAMIGAAAHLTRELGADAVLALGEWTAADGPLWGRLPRQWIRAIGRPPDWDALTLAWRRSRRALCRRAFLVQPFCLAPGVALLLLHEEEVRGLHALHEAGAEGERSPALEWALAAGALSGV